MEIKYEETDWGDGRGNRCLRGTVVVDGKKFYTHEGMDGRSRKKLERMIRERLEKSQR